MSTPEAEQAPKGHGPALNPHYESLVNTLTKRRNLKLTEPQIRAILADAGISPGDVTEETFAEAFRIATQHRGRGSKHCSGKRGGDVKEGYPQRVSRQTHRPRSQMFVPKKKE